LARGCCDSNNNITAHQTNNASRTALSLHPSTPPTPPPLPSPLLYPALQSPAKPSPRRDHTTSRAVDKHLIPATAPPRVSPRSQLLSPPSPNTRPTAPAANRRPPHPYRMPQLLELGRAVAPQPSSARCLPAVARHCPPTWRLTRAPARSTN